jgi:hypothetical protein
LIFGDNGRRPELYLAEPLRGLIRQRAAESASKERFYAELGLSPHGWNKREVVTGALVDRICCALGVHPSSIYGRDYDIEEAS